MNFQEYTKKLKSYSKTDLRKIKCATVNGKYLGGINSLFLSKEIQNINNNFSGNFFDLSFLKENNILVNKYFSFHYYDFSFNTQLFVLKQDIISNSLIDLDEKNPKEEQIRELKNYINNKEIYAVSKVLDDNEYVAFNIDNLSFIKREVFPVEILSKSQKFDIPEDVYLDLELCFKDTISLNSDFEFLKHTQKYQHLFKQNKMNNTTLKTI